MSVASATSAAALSDSIRKVYITSATSAAALSDSIRKVIIISESIEKDIFYLGEGRGRLLCLKHS